MTLDALRGKGAFRCGCGTKVTVTVLEAAPSARCAWRDCHTIAVGDLDVPLCAEHARRLRVQLGVTRDGEYQLELMRRSVMYDREFDDDIETAVEKQRAESADRRLKRDPYRVRAPEPSWCYFMRHETNIKIGFSKDPRKRSMALAGAEILAKEPGAAQREAELHLKFAHLRLHGEWFEPGIDLMAYIEDLRKQMGLGPVPESSRQVHAKKMLARKRATARAKKQT
jgi:hypothetical protein